MRDYLIQNELENARGEFIKSIDPNAILSLASSYHNNEPCTTFKPCTHGGFNVCFYVEFEKDRWVVRVPIPSSAYWIDEKIEVEVATMKYVAANSTIPVPKIHAFSYQQNSPIQMAFIIMDYIEGKDLRQLGFQAGNPKRWSFSSPQPTSSMQAMYRGLGHLYTQMRKLEFPKIGALGFSPDDGTIQVRHRPLTVEILVQEREGLHPTARFPENKTFRTASEYAQALLWLGDNLLNKSKNATFDHGYEVLHAYSEFRRYITDTWLQPEQERGPFVLCHGDVSIRNLLWDDDINLVGVLDWEWSSVVPAQFLAPPHWLSGESLNTLCLGQKIYNVEVRRLNDAIRACQSRLDWSGKENMCLTLVVCALFYPQYVNDVFWMFLSSRKAGWKPLNEEGHSTPYKMTKKQVEELKKKGARPFLQRKRREFREYHNGQFEYLDISDEETSEDSDTNTSTNSDSEDQHWDSASVGAVA